MVISFSPSMVRENGSSTLFPTHKKRSSSSSNANQNKKKQRKNKHGDCGDSEDSDYVPLDESSSAIHRIFSPDEEISILHSMIEFKKEKGFDPNSDMTFFLGYLKDSQVIGHQIQKAQLSDKIKRLKHKFNKHASGTSSHDPLDSHLRTLLELAKKIWGEQNDEKSPETIEEIINSSSGDGNLETRLTKGTMGMLKESIRMMGPHYKKDRFEFEYPYLNKFLEREGFKISFKKKLNSITSTELEDIEKDSKRISTLKNKADTRATKAMENLLTELLKD